ncbi:MAG TPA: preprotein translocase subunit YajC [Novosphingobium sp.]|nr:preprotein translocase subunit YajC [Novosphingobium sp.]
MSSQTLSILAAAGGAGAAPPAWLQFLPLVAMGLIFWFLIIRPQMRRQKEQQAKIGGIKRGDQVVTGGGLVGKVTRVDDTYADIEIATGVKVKAVKSTIAEVLDSSASQPAND